MERTKFARMLVSAAVAIPIAATWVLFLTGELSAEEVTSASMEPTLAVGDRVIVRRWLDSDLVPGDIVVVMPQTDNGDPLVKRFVAGPGDTIELSHGTMLVNGHELEARVAPFPGSYHLPRVMLEDDQYFVLGDNYGRSDDSTTFGPVRRTAIIGKVWLRYAPWERRGDLE